MPRIYPQPRWYSALVLALVTLVVSRLRMLSGSCVGPGAREGLFYRCSLAALRHGSPATFRRWLAHPRPQIRVLGLVCLALHQPSDLHPLVEPLTRDASIVTVRSAGCMCFELTISKLTSLILAKPYLFGHSPGRVKLTPS